ncbi:MAG: DUF3995 domain-containing protein [Rhizobiales bacterium]|nr:DUF3995 domain-containing protein [Hyphomicrobiales bacterium]
MALIAGLALVLISAFRGLPGLDISRAGGGQIRAALLPSTSPNTLRGRAGFASIGRVTGDFNPSGFLGKPDGSVSARLDTAYYSPLCLLLGMTASVLAARGHW